MIKCGKKGKLTLIIKNNKLLNYQIISKSNVEKVNLLIKRVFNILILK